MFSIQLTGRLKLVRISKSILKFFILCFRYWVDRILWKEMGYLLLHLNEILYVRLSLLSLKPCVKSSIYIYCVFGAKLIFLFLIFVYTSLFISFSQFIAFLAINAYFHLFCIWFTILIRASYMIALQRHLKNRWYWVIS